MDIDGSDVVGVATIQPDRSSTAHGRPTASGSSIATRPAGSTKTTRSSSPARTARSGGISLTTRRTTGARTGRRTATGSRSTPTASGGGLRRAGSSTRTAPGFAASPSTAGWSTHRSRRTAPRIAYMGAVGGNYEIFMRATSTPASERSSRLARPRWLARVVAGRATIAFTSVRDDCALAAGRRRVLGDRRRRSAPRHLAGRRRRLEPAARVGEPASSSPGPRTAGYLLISGYALYVVRGPTARGGWSCAPRASTARSAASPTGVRPGCRPPRRGRRARAPRRRS